MYIPFGVQLLRTCHCDSHMSSHLQQRPLQRHNVGQQSQRHRSIMSPRSTVRLWMLVAAILPMVSMAFVTTTTSLLSLQRTATSSALGTTTTKTSEILNHQPEQQQHYTFNKHIGQFPHLLPLKRPSNLSATSTPSTFTTSLAAATSTALTTSTPSTSTITTTTTTTNRLQRRSAWTSDLGDSALRNVQNLASKVATATNNRNSSRGTALSNPDNGKVADSNGVVRSGDRVQSALQSLEQDSEWYKIVPVVMIFWCDSSSQRSRRYCCAFNRFLLIIHHVSLPMVVQLLDQWVLERPQLTFLEFCLLLGSVLVAGAGPLMLHGEATELLSPAAAACKYSKVCIMRVYVFVLYTLHESSQNCNSTHSIS